MDRQTGITEPTAAEQLQRSYPRSPVQPLPAGKPGRALPADVGITGIERDFAFYVIGDSGGIKTPGPQNAVSVGMQQEASSVKPAFVFHAGDIVYFHGEAGQDASQFYEPYAHLAVPIVGVPGNHDGDVAIDDAGNPTGRSPLDTFMANFCSSKPAAPACDPQLEYGRHTQTQPYCDWTLYFNQLTIVGLYTNVVEGGHLEASQIAWLTGELQAAPADRPLIIVLHHPPYSVDAHHGGSVKMGAALDQAFEGAKRCADLVVSGHVHNYQRFDRVYWAKHIPYLVVGNSGYHNLHKLAAGATPGQDLGNGVTFAAGDDSHYGFLALQVTAKKLSGRYFAVTPGKMPDGSDATVSLADTFTVG